MKRFYVYIMTNKSGTLYIGMTNNLERRVLEHKSLEAAGFTRKYKITRLLYYEEYPTAAAAIEREKRLKGWVRARKVALIEAENPEWRDLAE